MLLRYAEGRCRSLPLRKVQNRNSLLRWSGWCRRIHTDYLQTEVRSLQHSDECWKSWSLSCYRKNCYLRSCWSCHRRRNHRRSCHPADSAVLPALPWLLPRPLPADGLPLLPLLQPLPAGGLLLLLPLLRWLPGLPHRLLPGLPQTSSGLP